MNIRGLLFQPITEECPYIEGITAIYENLFVTELEDEDLDNLLGMGFRHFGEIRVLAHAVTPICSCNLRFIV